jgi:hypothetical protein
MFFVRTNNKFLVMIIAFISYLFIYLDPETPLGLYSAKRNRFKNIPEKPFHKIIYASSLVFNVVLASVAEPRAAGAEIKLPPGAEIKLPSGAGVVIMNYDSGSGSSIFYERFEKI